LLRLGARDLNPARPAVAEPAALRVAVRYIADRPYLLRTIALVGIVGTFGLNFPIVLTAMASEAFGGGAGTYALFNVTLAVGSVAGALLAATRAHTRLRLIVVAAAAFGVSQAAAAAAPGIILFLGLLLVMGLANLAFQAMANASVQLWSDPQLRGRIMGIYMLVFIGGTPIGAPIIGAITSHFGPRVGMCVCGAAPAVAAAALAMAYAAAGRRTETHPIRTRTTRRTAKPLTSPTPRRPPRHNPVQVP
jgi:MFS family permease